MKSLVGFALVLATALGPLSGSAQVHRKAPGSTSTVITLDRQFWRAVLADDRATYDRLVADDAVIQANGDLRNKVEYWKEISGPTRPFARDIHTIRAERVAAHVAGKQVVVDGRVTFRFPDRNRVLKDAFAYRNAYELRAGKWLLVHNDWSRVGAESKPGPRGLYFAKKKYTPEPIPTFAQNRDRLPEPILDGDPGWIDMYWKCWEIGFRHIKKPRPDAPLVSNFLDEAFNDSIFQWDTIFMVMFARYAHHVFPAIQSLDNFYARQHADGFMCREIAERDGSDIHFGGIENTVNPPLFSWAEVESYKLTGDRSRYALVLPVIEKYVAWLEKNRRKPSTAHGLYWQTPLGSGMDNTPRTGSGWTDMSCQMVMLYNDMAAMSDALGRVEQAKAYRARAREIGHLINRWMWNEEDGLYYDVDDAGRHVKWKTSGCFWPMLAGIASKQQTERLVAHLRDPSSFWRKIPFPTLAADQKGYNPKGEYWLGSVWAPTNLAIIKGLEATGHEDLAAESTERYLAGMYEVFKTTGTVWENYAPDHFEQGSQAKPDFVGWTGCGPIALLIENVMGLRADGARHELTWRLRRTDRHGVERLRFGNATVSVVCAERASPDSPARLSITCDRPVLLRVVRPTGEKVFRFTAGAHQLTV